MSDHLCTRGGQEPTPEDLAKVEQFRAFLAKQDIPVLPQQEPFVAAAALDQEVELQHTRKGPAWAATPREEP